MLCLNRWLLFLSFSFSFSTIICLLIRWFSEISIDVLWKRAILESVRLLVVSWQGVHLDLVGFGLEKVVECSVLSSALALIPVLNFDVAHPWWHVLGFDAVGHPLHKGVTWMRLHVNWIKWFHSCFSIIKYLYQKPYFFKICSEISRHWGFGVLGIKIRLGCRRKSVV